MINPYEPTVTFSRMERRSWKNAIVLVAAVVGYGVPIAALGLTAWLTNGLPAAVDNLERVVRIHGTLSVNTILAHIPNIALAILVAIATTRWIDSDETQRKWWLLSCATIVGYVVVLFSIGYWNLMPWTWPSELHNAVRSTLTLMFPLGAYLLMAFNGWRTNNVSH